MQKNMETTRKGFYRVMEKRRETTGHNIGIGFNGLGLRLMDRLCQVGPLIYI